MYTLEEYREETKRTFAYFGFTDCPLTDAQMNRLFYLGLSVSKAYEIGCDVSAGYSFTESLAEHTNTGD